jgi:hypothetical protein
MVGIEPEVVASSPDRAAVICFDVLFSARDAFHTPEWNTGILNGSKSPETRSICDLSVNDRDFPLRNKSVARSVASRLSH